MVLPRFTPLFTYKVLKHEDNIIDGTASFTPLFTYKVLKQICLLYTSDAADE